MKYLKLGALVLIVMFTFHFAAAGSSVVYADDDEREEHYEGPEGRDGEGVFEDVGGNVGWGTVIAMGAAGLILPVRRSMKSVIKKAPGAKTLVLSTAKFLGKYHIFIGILALILVGFHGTLMYLSEGELEGEGILGLGAAILMVTAGILGAFLFRNKKAKSLRTTHTIIVAIAILIAVVHIAS